MVASWSESRGSGVTGESAAPLTQYGMVTPHEGREVLAVGNVAKSCGWTDPAGSSSGPGFQSWTSPTLSPALRRGGASAPVCSAGSSDWCAAAVPGGGAPFSGSSRRGCLASITCTGAAGAAARPHRHSNRRSGAVVLPRLEAAPGGSGPLRRAPIPTCWSRDRWQPVPVPGVERGRG